MAVQAPDSLASDSLASTLAVAWECQQRVEEFALPFALAFDVDEEVSTGLHVHVDDLAGMPELRMVKLLHFADAATDASWETHDLYLVLRLQTPDDGFRVAAEILVDLRHEVGDLGAGEHTLFSEVRKTATLGDALTELRALTGNLCAQTDLPARLGV